MKCCLLDSPLFRKVRITFASGKFMTLFNVKCPWIPSCHVKQIALALGAEFALCGQKHGRTMHARIRISITTFSVSSASRFLNLIIYHSASSAGLPMLFIGSIALSTTISLIPPRLHDPPAFGCGALLFSCSTIFYTLFQLVLQVCPLWGFLVKSLRV